MRRLLVRVLFYSIAVGLTIAILSIVRIPTTEHPDGVPLLSFPPPEETNIHFDITFGPIQLNIVVAIVFVIGAAVFPIILAAVFGRWYMRSPVAAFVLVSAVTFWLVALVSDALGHTFQVPDPALLWLFVDALVFGVVFMVLDTVFGLQRPHMSDAARHRSLWSRLDRMPISRRNQIVENIRMYEVWNTISAYAQEIAVGGTALGRFRGVVDRLAGSPSANLSRLSTPAKVRVMLEQLGPTYVKLGQMVGGRRELLPEGWSVELAKLQSTVPPFPWSTAEAVLRDELGAPPSELFGSIEEEPLGAASLAQVHRATLKDGRQVVVKIQRPDIQALVRADLGVMQQLAEVAEERFEGARRFGLSAVIAEFSDGVLQELDYTTEAYNASRLADVLSPIEGVGVPAVYPELSTRRVLVMDFVAGVKATHADELDPSVDRQAVARTLITALIKQVLIDGFFHADPHPGNVVLDPATGRVVFLDLGLMGELRQEQRLDLIALVWALRMEDPALLALVVRRLCRATGPVDEAAFRTAIERIFYRAWVYGRGSFSGVMGSLFGVLGEHHLQMRRELVLAIKAITQAEQLVSAIAPGLPLVTVIAEEGQGLLRAQLGGELAKLRSGEVTDVLMGVVRQASTLGDAFLPHLVEAIVSGGSVLGAGREAAVDLEPLERRVDRLSERLDHQLGRLAWSVAFVGIAVVAAGIVLAILPRETDVLIGFDLLAIAFAVGIAGFLLFTVRGWRRADAAWLAALRDDPGG
jgi:ubiquinone biosynthesis protein